MRLSRLSRGILGAITAVVLAVIYLPLSGRLRQLVQHQPEPDLATARVHPRVVGEGLQQRGCHRMRCSPACRSAAASTVISLVLGTLISLALQRFEFFGRDAISLLVILPIALPGIITGIALNNAFSTVAGVQLSIVTLIVAHATFCIVTVFNNVIARLRRLGTNFEDASADLGAGLWTTFRLVTFPQLRSALFAGGLLAFALSFDEIIVTTFTAGAGVTTLPIWILNNLFRPNQAPVVNVIAVVLVLVSIIPIYIAQRIAGAEKIVR